METMQAVSQNRAFTPMTSGAVNACVGGGGDEMMRAQALFPNKPCADKIRES